MGELDLFTAAIAASLAGDGIDNANGSVGASSWNDINDKPTYLYHDVVEIFPETEYECEVDEWDGVYYSANVLDFYSNVPLVAGQEYTVIYDNVAYTEEAYVDNYGAVSIGNENIFGHNGDGINSDVSFFVEQYGDYYDPLRLYFFSSDTSASSHTIEILIDNGFHDSLDPTKIGVRWDDIANKPFYCEKEDPVVIFPETAITANDRYYAYDPAFYAYLDLSEISDDPNYAYGHFSIHEDEEYIVTFDGIKYNLTSYSLTAYGADNIFGYPIIGNPHIVENVWDYSNGVCPESANYDVPFLIDLYDGYAVFYISDQLEHTFKIEYIATRKKVVDEECVSVDWKNIKNKPFKLTRKLIPVFNGAFLSPGAEIECKNILNNCDIGTKFMVYCDDESTNVDLPAMDYSDLEDEWTLAIGNSSIYSPHGIIDGSNENVNYLIQISPYYNKIKIRRDDEESHFYEIDLIKYEYVVEETSLPSTLQTTNVKWDNIKDKPFGIERKRLTVLPEVLAYNGVQIQNSRNLNGLYVNEYEIPIVDCASLDNINNQPLDGIVCNEYVSPLGSKLVPSAFEDNTTYIVTYDGVEYEMTRCFNNNYMRYYYGLGNMQIDGASQGDYPNVPFIIIVQSGNRLDQSGVDYYIGVDEVASIRIANVDNGVHSYKIECIKDVETIKRNNLPKNITDGSPFVVTDTTTWIEVKSALGRGIYCVVVSSSSSGASQIPVVRAEYNAGSGKYECECVDLHTLVYRVLSGDTEMDLSTTMILSADTWDGVLS